MANVYNYPDGQRPPGAGGGDVGSMDFADARITRLETHFEYIKSDLGEIRVALDGMNGRLDHLPTKRDLTTNILVIVTIGVAVIAIVVGGLVSGLGWLETRASRVQTAPTPIVIQIPQPESRPVRP